MAQEFASHPRILIADDYPHSAESLARRLRRELFEVEIALNGREAIQAADQFHPDIALLDLEMPLLDGYEVAHWLKRQSWAGNILLIAITGYGHREELARTREAGFDAHLVKPVEHAVLIGLLTGFQTERQSKRSTDPPCPSP
jgi:CheY-like chemotaxis protein